MQSKTDKELLDRYVASHDEAAFAELVTRYGSMVYRTCRRLLGSDQEAEDATQAAFIVLARKTGSLRQEGHLNGWLHRVSRNVALQALRRRSDYERQRSHAALWHESVASTVLEPETDAVLRLTDAELDGLSAILREAVILRYLRGFSEQEAATLAGCPLGTMKRRASDGLAKLRARLAKRGIAVGVPVLAAALEAEASAAIPETLLSSTLTAVKAYAAGGAATATVSANVVALTKGVLNMMFWNGVKIGVAVAVGVAAVAGGGVAAVRAVGQKEPSPAELSQPDTAQNGTNTVFVTPRGVDAWKAFRELTRQGGARVVMLGRYGNLLVPAELRWTPVEGRKLVEAVAAANTLKVAWRRDGRYAVLYPGAPDNEIELTRRELDGPNVVSRRRGAWRAGWLRDIRVVPMLVKGAKDQDAETARQSLVGLRRIGWAAVVVLDETAFGLLAAELDSPLVVVREEAILVLGNVGGEKAVIFLEKEIDNKDVNRRVQAVYVLGNVGGEKALTLLEKALDDEDTNVRVQAVYALGNVGGKKALALLEKALDNKNVSVRRAAVGALGEVRNEKALAVIEKTLDDKDASVRLVAVGALGEVGGEKVLTFFEKSFDNKEPYVRETAVRALGNVGGEKALVLLEKILDHKDASVRQAAVDALGNVGGERALALIEKALDDNHADVRWAAFRALGNLGGEKALALIEKVFDDKDVSVRRVAVGALGYVGGEKALAFIEKPLNDKDTKVRWAAVNALVNVGGQKTRDLLLGRLVSEEDHSVLEAIHHALGQYCSGDPVVAKNVE